MQAKPELGPRAAVPRGLGRRRPGDHEARARNYAALVRFHDSTVDTPAQAEVVRVYDQKFRQSHLCRGPVRRPFSLSSRSYWRRYPSLVPAEQDVRASPRPRAALTGARRVRRLLRSLVASADLLWALTESDLRFRYGRGRWRFIRWVLEPFALVGVYLVLVTFVFDRPGTAVGLSLACSVVPFQFVILTMQNAMTALEVRRPILLNMKFNRMLIPTASALTETAGFGSSFLLIIFMMSSYRIAPTWNILWFPLVLLVNLLLAVAVAYPAILFGIWLRELKAFVMSFVRFLFFLSPGLVPLSQTRPGIRDILRFNPLTGIFEAYRDVFLFGATPAAWELVYPLVAVVVLLAVFVPIYRSEQRQFAKVI